MEIIKVRVQNFRCIKDEEIKLKSLTTLVGRNGIGKSAFLYALKYFYEPSVDYSKDDFYNRNTDNTINITVTFANLSDGEKDLFEKYVENEELIVEKELAYPPNKSHQKYYGTLPRCPEFEVVRDDNKLVPEKRDAYFDLYEEEALPELPDLRGNISGKDLETALEDWEEEHPEHLELSHLTPPNQK